MFKFKEGENFNHRNTLSILRIALKLHFVQNVESDTGTLVKRQRYLGKRGRFAKVSQYVRTDQINIILNERQPSKF